MRRATRFGAALGVLALTILAVAVTPAVAPPPPDKGGGGGRSDENHFRCYVVSQQTPQAAQDITLEDQFTENNPQQVTVGEPVWFCPPAEKLHNSETFEIEDEQEHYTFYNAPNDASPRNVVVTDQFNPNGASWEVTTPKYIAVPTAKTINGQRFDDVDDMNHYWCYEANGPRVRESATLTDQFSGPDNVRVTVPRLLCNPAEKVHNGETFPIEDENLHLACYEIFGKQKTEQFRFTAENQFETDEFQTASWELLCAPAEKQEL